MRLLTRLVLSAAAALTAWLLSGVVTVRALDDPGRLGLLPGLHVPLIAFAVLLAASGALRTPAAAAGPVLLACVSTAPWWPVPLPPALLLLAGPLGWIWFVACLSCAIVWPTGHWWWWRARRFCADPRRAPLLAAGGAVLLLWASAWHMAPRHPDGDEPDYLIIAQSLLHDGDLQIENNHRRFDYEAYHDGELPPSYLQRGRNGQIYPVHAPGLPVLLLPAMAVAGYPGAVATVVLLCAAGVGLLWRLCWLVTDSAPAAWFGTAAAALAAPFFLHAFVVFPDAPAGVLCLVAVWAFVEPSRFRGWRLAWPALALGWLPWMHTRYAVLAAGLGLGVVLMQRRERRVTEWLWFVVPAAAAAAAWFAFFWVIYGTPNPAAPYGAYTQTAWRQVPPGLAGLIVDQQFGLLANAPVLALVAVGVWRARAAGLTGPAWVIVGTAVAYTLLTASYRMWWGGLSAPARFLGPLVLPAGLLVAVGWHGLRTATSRHVATWLLVASLLLTGFMVGVEHGRLAYNVRDGAALWAAFASPVVDLPAALPAAHRDAPALVARDAALWVLSAGLAWVLLRRRERHRPPHAVEVLAALGLAVAAAATAVWVAHDVSPLAPTRSQLRWTLRDAAERDATLLVLSGERESRQGRFDLDLMSPPRGLDAFTALQADDVPAGQYRLYARGLEPGTTLGVAIGTGRATSFIATATATERRVTVADVVLPLPVDRLTVRSSTRTHDSGARVWLRPTEVVAPPGQVNGPPRATRAESRDVLQFFYPERGVHAESGGFWVGGDADVTIGVAGPPGTRVSLTATAGARDVRVRVQVGARADTLRLDAGSATPLDLGRLPSRGAQVVRLSVEGGFRPVLMDPSSTDGRRLGVWVTLDQNLTTPLR